MSSDDKQNEAAEFLKDKAIEAIRSKAKSKLFTGYCYYCYSPVRSPHIFCDPGCMEDWEKEEKIRMIEGR